jgi:D-glycero-D-manno-heptose 1,7-bisphosphate phosphatase
VKKRGVLLDRDGTLIDVVRDAELGVVVTAYHPGQLRLLPGVVQGLRALASHGFLLAIATNQPGAAKGQVPREAIERTNAALVALLRTEGVAIASVAVCLHHPEGGPGGDVTLVGPCSCRKPKPGLLRALIDELDLDAAASFMVGDTPADLEAGRAAGTRTALLFEPGRCELCPLRGPRESSDARPPGRLPDLVAGRFDELARAIVEASP